MLPNIAYVLCHHPCSLFISYYALKKLNHLLTSYIITIIIILNIDTSMYIVINSKLLRGLMLFTGNMLLFTGNIAVYW